MENTQPQASPVLPRKKKSLVIVLFGLGIFLLAFLGYFAYFTHKNHQSPDNLGMPRIIGPDSTFTPDPTANWKTYKGSLGDQDTQMTLKHPPSMIPSRGNCDSFILPDSDEERQNILSIRDKGIEFGFYVEGLELASCIMSNPNNLSVEEFAKNHSPKTSFKFVDLNGYGGVKSDTEKTMSERKFIEYFVNYDSQIVRIWYRYGKEQYKPIADQILSTFKFID